MINELILKFAKEYKVNPATVYGICRQESSMNPMAIRHEPAYKWVWKPKECKPASCSLDTERMLQKTSIGLMQIMGAVCREYGFRGWLTEVVCDPFLQLNYGCMHLKKKLLRFGETEGIAAYNTGSPRYNSVGKLVNQYYLDDVLKYAATAEATGLLQT